MGRARELKKMKLIKGFLLWAGFAQGKLSNHDAITRISMMEESPLFDEWRRELTEIYDPNPLRVSFFALLHQIFGQEAAPMAYQDIARRQKLPQTSMETYEDNINWLHELLLDEDRIEMIQKMEQLPNVLAMSTPRYAWMEKFNGCFIIANFDSLEGDKKEAMHLLETLSANFNEKCVIAANDVSFPSNRAIVEQLNIKEFPSLMLKKPASQIVKLEEKEERWEEVVKPVENWGKIVTKLDIELSNNLMNDINEYLYAPLTEEQKIIAIYSPELAGSEPEKYMMMMDLIDSYYVTQINEREKYSMGKMKADIAASVYADKSPESVTGLMQHWLSWPEAKTLKEYLELKLEELKDKIPETAITRLQPLIQI